MVVQIGFSKFVGHARMNFICAFKLWLDEGDRIANRLKYAEADIFYNFCLLNSTRKSRILLAQNN